MNFANKLKAASIVASLVIIGALGATIYHLPNPWAVDLLKLLVGGAITFLLIDKAGVTVSKKDSVAD